MSKIVAGLMLASVAVAAALTADAEARAQRAETQLAVASKALNAWAAAPACDGLIADVLRATAGEVM